MRQGRTKGSSWIGFWRRVDILGVLWCDFVRSVDKRLTEIVVNRLSIIIDRDVTNHSKHCQSVFFNASLCPRSDFIPTAIVVESRGRFREVRSEHIFSSGGTLLRNRTLS